MEISRSKQNKIWFWIFSGLTLSFMAFVFHMSSQNIKESLETSGGMTQWLAGLFYGRDAMLTEAMLEPVSILVRKTAHMAEYAILFLLSYGTVHFYSASYGSKGQKPLSVKIKWLIAYGWTVFYAGTDEFHQIFSGRGAMVVDVIIDAFGATIATALLFGTIRVFTTKGAKKKAGWGIATLTVMFCVYVLSFLLFHREIFGLFF